MGRYKLMVDYEKEVVKVYDDKFDLDLCYMDLSEPIMFRLKVLQLLGLVDKLNYQNERLEKLTGV